jgi:hypothetical protein
VADGPIVLTIPFSATANRATLETDLLSLHFLFEREEKRHGRRELRNNDLG